jgi:hypothetical protein
MSLRPRIRVGISLAIVFLVLCAAVLADDPCRYCRGDKLLKKMHFVDGDKSVCELCAKKLPKCDECHLPTDLPKLRDGRFFCPSCKSLGVWTETTARNLQQSVVTYLQSLLGPTALKPCPPVKVVDQDEIQTKFTASGRSIQVSGFYQANNPEMVYLLSGSPPIELLSVMSHEYTHAWQSRNCPAQDRALSEGFACWTQYKFLVSRGELNRAEQLTRHQDSDYGASLVKILEREKKIGPVKLVEWVKKARNLSDP